MLHKFNSGAGALLCDNCSIICASGDRIPSEVKYDHNANLYFFCSDKCKNEFFEKLEKRCRIIGILG